MTIGGARPRPAGLALQDPPLPQTRGAGRTIWEDRNMKKRLISWLLILALCVSVLPAAALAAEPEDTALTGAEQTVDPAEPARSVFTSGEETHAHYLCGGATCNQEGHDDEGNKKVTFTAWPGIKNVGNGGAYYLTGDIGGFTVPNGVDLTLCLNGHDISQTSENGPVVTVEPGATFTLCDCKGSSAYGGRIMHSSRDNTYGIGVYVGEKASVNNSAVFNMYSGTISNNTSIDRVDGGGVTVMGGTFNLYGGTISENKALSGSGIGGGVFVANQGTFNMRGGTITQNQAKLGGGVFVGGAYTSADKIYFNGTFDMSGGSISGNTAGGGVHVNTYSTLTTFKVSGTAKITGNLYDSATQNVYLESEDGNKAIIVVGKLDSSASIGVTTQEVGMTVAENISKVNADHFFSDNSKKYRLKYSSANQTLTMVEVTTEHTAHPVCGEAGCTKHDSVDSWTPISKLSEISGTGNYYLTSNVTLTEDGWKCTYDVTLCLNGFDIVMNADNKNAITISSGKTLNLCDCKGTGEITHGEDDNGTKYTGAGVITVNSTFNMYGGTITGNRNTFGAGVRLDYGSTFNMYGGSITGNEVYYATYSTDGCGGGVNVAGGATFNMHGGSITNNTAVNGGGVYAKGISGGSDANFNMDGGTIEDNKVTNSGGGVYVDYGRFHMSGGSITGNTAEKYGGGVYYGTYNNLFVSGNVNITGNFGPNNTKSNVNVPTSSYGTPKTTPFCIGLNALDEDARIGVRLANEVIAEGEHSPVTWMHHSVETGGNVTNAYHEGNFILDNDGDYTFKMEATSEYGSYYSTHVVNLYNGLHEHPICGTKGCKDHGDVSWTGVDDLSKITAGTAEAPNYYFLTKDITTSTSWTAPDNVALCLNGHSIVSTTSGTTAITVNGTFTLTDCNGSNGVKYFKESTNGRWVSATKDDVDAITVNGGVIFHTSSGSTDKGMSLRSGKFYMYGGTICGNSGGVYVESGAAMTVSGNATVTGNAGSNANYNVYLNGVITVGGKLSDTAKIGVTTAGTNISAGNYETVAQSANNTALTEDDAKHFESDMSYTPQIRDGKVVFTNGTLHEHPLCGKTCAHAGDEKHTQNLLWEPLTSKSGVLYHGGSSAGIETAYKSTNYYYLRAGNYYLAEDITTDLPILISGNVNLCLNGKTLSTTLDQGSDDLTLIAVYQGKTLNLCDCDAEGKGTLKTEKDLTFGVEIWHPFSSGYTGGTFNMYGGTIAGVQRGVRPYTEKNGGKCTFKMYGGKITGTQRGVYVNDGSIFEMYGGEITNNDTKPTSTEDREYFGGGVVVDIGATFTMHGGTISNNNAYTGGGVCLLGESGRATTTFNMEGGTITGNTTTDGGGGGVYLGTNTAFNMSGNASVSGNTANGNCGGGVHVNTGSSFTMSGGTITNNTAKKFGGGVNLAGGTFNMSGNAAISGNNAGNGEKNGEGGGVCVSTGTFNMTGGSITGNNVYLSSDAFENEGGGGVYMAERATMNVSGNVQIKDNWKNGTLNNGVYEKGVTGSDNNLYLYAYNSGTPKVLKTVTIDSTGLASTAEIGVTTRYTPTASNPIQFATGATENLDYYAKIFTPDVTGQGYTITQTGTDLYLSAHTHDWEYSVSADNQTIIAKCKDNTCTSPNGGSVTINKPKHEVYRDGKDATAKVTQNSWAADTVSEVIYKNYTGDATPLSTAPTDAGKYIASITAGDKTASVTYEIGKATPTTDDFIFAGPKNLTYNGEVKIADFAWADGVSGMGKIGIRNYNYAVSNDIVSPIDAGTYTVKITVAEGTNYKAAEAELTKDSWTFTILQADYTGQKSDKTIDIVKGRSTAQTGTLTVEDFFPAETELPAGAKIASVTGSGTMMASVTVNAEGTLAYTSNTNVTATADETYTVTISTTNYNNFTATLTFHPVDKQPQTGFAFKDVVGGKVTKTYGDPDFKFEATGQVNGSNVTGYDSSNENVATVANDGTVHILKVGTTTITATASATDDYAEGKAEYTLTVSKKTLTEADLEFTTGSTFTKTYDGGTTCITATVQIKSAAKVNQNDVLPTVTGTYAYNSKDVKDATKVIFTSERTENTNYILPANLTVENAASITKRVLTVGNVTTTPKKYDGYDNATLYVTGIALNGTVSGETLTFYTTETGGDYGITGTKFDNANAGQNKQITGTVALLSSVTNYSFANGATTAPFTATGTITPADGGSKGSVERTQRFTDENPKTETIAWTQLLPANQTWNYNSSFNTSTGTLARVDHRVDNATGTLYYTITGGSTGDQIEFVVTAKCNNYDDFTYTVTVRLMARDPQTLVFEGVTDGKVAKTYGDQPFTQTVTGAQTKVTYTSNDENVAKVNAQTGEVTIVGAGDAVITATAAETDVYASASASYTLTVSKLRIAIPKPGKNELEYNGKEQTYTPDGLDTTYCSITDNTEKDVLANNANYTATVSLRDTANTEWDEEPNGAPEKTYSFRITPAPLTVTALDKKITTGQPAPELSKAAEGTDYTIDGLFDGDSFSNIELYYADPADTSDPKKEVTPDTSKAGTYAIVARLGGGTSSPNYDPTFVPGTLTIEAVQTSQKLGISAPGRTPGGSYELTPKNAKPGDTVTIAVSPDKGYELGGLTVRDMDGNELDLKRDRSGDYTFTMPKSSVRVSVTFVRADDALFDDVFAGDYYYNAVQWAAEQGITGGVSKNLFAPDAACTRAQIVTFLWRAAGSPEPETMSAFADVPATAYYAKAVAWAVENGITNGTGDGKFSPDAPCTRAQAVTFLARALDESADGAADFTDVSADAYYAKPVAWAVEANVTNGVSKTQFAPNENCTRAQIVTFLYRAYKRMK